MIPGGEHREARTAVAWIIVLGASIALTLPAPLRAGEGSDGPGTPGPLLIIGGHEDKDGNEDVLRTFVRLAGGPPARIVLLTCPSESPGKIEADYRRAFDRLGVRHLRVVEVENREQADDGRGAEEVEGADGVFFTGGSQERVARSLRGTRLESAIRRRWGGGMVVGGTSAGAAVMPETMLVDGDSGASARRDSTELGRGLGLLPGVIVDSHFDERGRVGRLLAAVAEHRRDLGLGLGENTALVVRGDEFEVVGAGVVTVLDPARLADRDREDRGSDGPLALINMTLHALPAGYRYNLRTRIPTAPDGRDAGRGHPGEKK